MLENRLDRERQAREHIPAIERLVRFETARRAEFPVGRHRLPLRIDDPNHARPRGEVVRDLGVHRPRTIRGRQDLHGEVGRSREEPGVVEVPEALA